MWSISHPPKPKVSHKKNDWIQALWPRKVVMIEYIACHQLAKHFISLKAGREQRLKSRGMGYQVVILANYMLKKASINKVHPFHETPDVLVNEGPEYPAAIYGPLIVLMININMWMRIGSLHAPWRPTYKIKQNFNLDYCFVLKKSVSVSLFPYFGLWAMKLKHL